MIAFKTEAEWRVAELPPPHEPVIALSADGDIGEAFHNGTVWTWTDGHKPALVAAWSRMPDPEWLLGMVDPNRPIPYLIVNPQPAGEVSRE